MMNIATLKGEASVEALAQRIYGAAANKRPELAERLIEANPHLQDLESLPQGTPIVVPRTGDTQIDDVLATADDPQRTAAIADLTEALDDLERQQNEMLTRREETLAESARVATLPAVRVGAGADVVPQLDAIVRDVGKEVAAIAQERTVFANELKAARAILHPPRRRAVRK